MVAHLQGALIVTVHTEPEELDVAETEEPEVDSLSYDITYYPADYTLQGYVDKAKSGQLVIPPFQRNYVWDQVRASKLIESFLLGLPVPGVFLYKDKLTNKLEIIDGQQRILSVIRFFDGAFDERPFRLKNVQPRWDGKLFSELADSDRFQLQDAVLRATVIQQLDPDDHSSVFHIFERLNTGGVKLSPMEIRKAIFHGQLFELLERLNADSNWRLILGLPRKDKRLKDIELVLRVLALAEEWETYEKPMKGFLNRFMDGIRSLDPEVQAQRLDRLEAAFTQCCETVVGALGGKPCHLKGRLNLAALDALMVACMGFVPNDPRQLKVSYAELLRDEAFIEAVSVSTSDKSAVQGRIQKAVTLLRSA